MRSVPLTLLALAATFIAAPALADEPAPPPPAKQEAKVPPAPPPAAPSPSISLQAIGAALEQHPPAPPPGNDVLGPVFPEDKAPPVDPASPHSIRFALHGYFRAPLRIGWQKRDDVKSPDEATTNLRTPRLVDDDYARSGFLYTRNAEQDFTELYLMAGNDFLTGTVALEGSLYSDAASVVADRQLGISKGYLTFRHAFAFGESAKLRLKIKGGAFSDRFGWQEKYDTYLFGRTHQMGEQVRAELDVGKFTFSVLDGFGAHLDNIKNNQGLSLLHYLRLSASYDKVADLSFYYLRTWTQDKQPLQDVAPDGSMRVMGVEARVDTGAFGRVTIGLSGVSQAQGHYLADSVEVMHSMGGRGLEQNYIGAGLSQGTGSLLNLGFQYDFSAKALLKKLAGTSPLGEADATLSVFGMYSKISATDTDPDPLVNKDGVQKFKWGAELALWPVSFLGASVRYDRVIADIHDDPSSFRVISPRLTLRTHWIADAQLFAQWSHYMYGERIQLRTSVNGVFAPDPDMFKIQAQLSF